MTHLPAWLCRGHNPQASSQRGLLHLQHATGVWQEAALHLLEVRYDANRSKIGALQYARTCERADVIEVEGPILKHLQPRC